MKTINNYNFDEIINAIKSGKVDTLCIVTSSIHEDDEYDAGDYIAEYDEPCFAGTTADECRQTINSLVADAEAEEYQYISFFAGQIHVSPEDVEDFDTECDDAEDFLADFIADNLSMADNIGTSDWNMQDVHYNGYEPMLDGIVLYWAWDRYIGYARTFKSLEYCTENVTTLSCKPIDHVFSTQCSLLVSADDVKTCSNASELRDIIQHEFDIMGKWRSDCNVDEFLRDLYKDAERYRFYNLPENDIYKEEHCEDEY